MRWVAPLALVAVGCSDPKTGTLTDAAVATGDDATDGMQLPDFVDPAWPAHVPLEPEFDFPPYLNLFDATTVVVNWRTMNASTGTVRYGTASDALTTELASSTSATVHHVRLQNLAPATAYHYEVAITGTTAVRKGVFVTPGNSQWRFLASGEYHAPSEVTNVAKFADEIRTFRPHVLIESGDMVDDGNDLTHWRSYMRTSAPWISNVLILPAHSNHVNGSDGNNNLLDLFVLPHNERWYLTRYSQVLFYSLDSHYTGNSDVQTDEVPWLEDAVTAAHDGTDDPTFNIAAWHHPACSSQYSSRSSDRLWIQANFVKTFTDNGGVDLILAAHDKYYERSSMIGGIVHIITNIGNISPSSPGSNNPACTPQKTIRDTVSTALVSVDGNALSVRVIDETGAELDTVNITK